MVIPLGKTGLKKAMFVYLLNLFGGRGGKGWCDLVSGTCLDKYGNGYSIDVFFTYG